jgi:hypothetical protein
MKPYSIARAALLNQFSPDWQMTMKQYVVGLVYECCGVDVWINGVWFKMNDGVLEVSS